MGCKRTAADKLRRGYEDSDLETYSTTIQRTAGCRVQGDWLARLRTFVNSDLFYVAQTVMAALFVVFGEEPLGILFLAGILALVLVISNDIMPTLLPFLLLCTIATNCYDSFNYFIDLISSFGIYAIYAPLVLTCIILHFILYGLPMRGSGKSIFGIGAVSLAVCLGGIGEFSLEEYLQGFYYLFGLGLGMMIAYFIMRGKYFTYRSYDFKRKFSLAMSMVGFACIAMVICGYLRIEFKVLDIKQYHYRFVPGFSRNNICTLLMFAMPFPLYLAAKKGSTLWAIGTPLIYAAIAISTSRGGLIFGGAEFGVCCLYWILVGEKKWARFFICVAAAVVLLLLFGGMVWEIIESRLLSSNAIQGSERARMIEQAFERFFKDPIFGSGILDDSIAYGQANKKGTMAWYHMMVPQVIGSMGLIGVFAYGYQIIGRSKLILQNKSTWSLCLGLSYLGILLMSQVNPGEFCPLPFELLTVLLFILQEYRLEDPQFPLWQRKA